MTLLDRRGLRKENLSVTQLLHQIADGDRKAFEALYHRVSRLCYAVILRLVRDEQEASDVLQEVFVRIWTKAPQFLTLQCSAESWIVTIARHAAIDRLRQHGRRGVMIDLEDLEISADGPDGEGAAIQACEVRNLNDCLARLPPDRAEAVRRAYMEGWSYAELAASAGIPLNTMRTWLRRSLHRLRACMDMIDR